MKSSVSDYTDGCSCKSVTVKCQNSGETCFFKVLFLLFLFSAFCDDETFSQQDSLIVFSGILMEDETDRPVPYAYIASYTQHLMYSSDSSGRFFIYLPVHDSLKIVTLGFSPVVVKLDSLELQNSDDVVIQLKRSSYLLRNVDVNLHRGFFDITENDEDKAKERIIHLEDLNSGNKNIVDIREVMGLQRAKAGTFGITPGSIAMIARIFKRKKQRKHLIFDISTPHLKELISPKNLSEYTGFKGARLDSFIVFLRKHYTFDPKFNDYEVMEMVQTACDKFMALNDRSK